MKTPEQWAKVSVLVGRQSGGLSIAVLADPDDPQKFVCIAVEKHAADAELVADATRKLLVAILAAALADHAQALAAERDAAARAVLARCIEIAEATPCSISLGPCGAAIADAIRGLVTPMNTPEREV